jgi:hypothetical protein
LVHEYNGSICISIDYNNIAFLNAWSSSIDHELNDYELNFKEILNLRPVTDTH